MGLFKKDPYETMTNQKFVDEMILILKKHSNFLCTNRHHQPIPLVII